MTYNDLDRAAKYQRIREIAATMPRDEVRAAIQTVQAEAIDRRRTAAVDAVQRVLVAGGRLHDGSFTPGQWGRVSESAAGDLLAAATAAGVSPLEVLENRGAAQDMDDDEAEAMLTSLGL